MVFKLVQIDSDNSLKIKLEVGTHIFGRGKFLNVNDKRISRQHGQFEVADDSLIITALHQNPCFYEKRGTTHIQILHQNNSVSLNTGDKLGLLPTSHWYEVLECKSVDNEENKETDKQSPETAVHKATVDSSEETDNETDSRPNVNTNEVSENDNPDSQATQVLSSSDLDKEKDICGVDFNKENCSSDSGSGIEKVNVDTEQANKFDSEKTQIDGPMSPSVLSSSQENEEKPHGITSSLPDQPSTPQKRALDGEDAESEEVKKIKTEPEIKPDVDGLQAGSSNANVAVNPPQPVPAPAVAPAQLRERCMYGASCYRRNPVHRAQFSHPHDVDWGTGEKAPCPWGAACGKRDPRHWRDHDHPPGKEQPPPPPPQPGKQKKRDRSSTPPNSLIVTGKRVRRSVAKGNWILSDESDSDPYQTDGQSDEWEPSSEYTESQN